MSDTRVQLEVEDWVLEHWMSEQFVRSFYRYRVKLCSGGVFDFVVVSEESLPSRLHLDLRERDIGRQERCLHAPLDPLRHCVPAPGHRP